MQSIKQRGYDIPDGILTVDEALEALSALLKKEGKIW
jgi:energy-coupling factor transport system ATP-binding protein